MEDTVSGTPPVCTASGEELAEGRSYLGDHVGGGGGTPILLEGLMVTLPCECASSPGSHQERAGAARQEHNQRPSHCRPLGSDFPPHLHLSFPNSDQLASERAASLQLSTVRSRHPPLSLGCVVWQSAGLKSTGGPGSLPQRQVGTQQRETVSPGPWASTVFSGFLRIWQNA